MSSAELMSDSSVSSSRTDIAEMLDRRDEPAVLQRTGLLTRSPTLLAKLAALHYYLSFVLYWAIIWATAVWLCLRVSWLWALFGPYVCYIWFFESRDSQRAEWPTPLKGWILWRDLAQHFNARIVKAADLDASKPHIFCFHPHAILSFSAWLTFATHATGFDKLYPGLDVRLLTLNINFKTPLWRNYLLLHGICDVSRRTCLAILSRGKSIAIVIGGGSESLLSRPGTNDIVLRRRQGFVRIALRSGASLVPVYAFGETNTYSTLAGLPRNSLLRRLQARMLKAWGWTIPIYWGRGLLLPWGMVPYPVQLTTMIGAPIEVPKYTGDVHSAEFHALVDKYHAIYMEALTKLFEDHKDKYAKGERGLRIVE